MNNIIASEPAYFLAFLQAARNAYEAVMVMRPRRPEDAQFAWFEAEVKRRAMTEYNFMWEKDNEVSSLEQGYLYITTLCLVHKLISDNLLDRFLHI